jgi:hypothetical protein
MKVQLTETEVREAVKEWCLKRFPIDEKTQISWKAILVDHAKGLYRLEFTLDGVEMPPKEGPYR